MTKKISLDERARRTVLRNAAHTIAHRLGIESLEQRRLLSTTMGPYPLDDGLHQYHDVHDDHVELSLLEYVPQRVLDKVAHVGAGNLLTDFEGRQFFFDPAPEAFAQLGDPEPVTGGTGGGTGGGGGGANAQPIYHSNPSSPYKIFLDFDGHVVANTAWNQFNNDNPIHAPAYSRDDDIFNFSTQDLEGIEETFLRVAEDFAPFNVDVTTEEPPLSAFTEGGKALRVMISTDVDDAAVGGTGNRWFSGAGGVAYLGSWRWTNDTPVWVFENNLGNGFAKYVTEAASHEVGHALDLRHDGTSSQGYYGGHGSGETGWAPLMGVGYSKPLSQWSKGEYNDANNSEDDLALMTASHNNITFRVDDHGNSPGTATNLVGIDNGTPEQPFIQFTGSGIISQRTDVDTFRLDLSAGDGRLQMSVLPFFHLSQFNNLDLEATLRDSSGNIVQTINPADQVEAIFDLELSAGIYTVSVDGVGQGDPLGLGYTDYGTLGQFDLLADFTPTTVSSDELIVDVNGSNQTFGRSDVTGYWTEDKTPAGYAIVDGGAALELSGNTWKKIPLPLNVTSDTFLKFDLTIQDAGEVVAIGFDNDNTFNLGVAATKRHFKLAGSQNWTDGHLNFNGVPADGGTYEIVIPVGQFHTGSMQYLTFLMDDDADASGNVKFANISIYEEAAEEQFTINVDGTPTPFELNSFSGYWDQDVAPGLSILPAENGFRQTGNSWKKVGLPYNVTSDSVMRFDVSITDAGEVVAIGFDNDNTFNLGAGAIKRHFQLAGSQNWTDGLQNYKGVPADGVTRTLEIPIGDFYTGQMQYLTFLMDDDADASGNVKFTNIEIFEDGDTTPGDFDEVNGLVVMEAENFSGGAAGTGSAVNSTWELISNGEASGDKAIQALPNVGVSTGNTTNGPRKDYTITFDTPGTWYAWARILGPTGVDDSIHLGFEGQLISGNGGYGISETAVSWRWLNRAGGQALKFNVPSAGTYTFNLWMREDGTSVDKLVLTRDPMYVPVGEGPGETASTPPAGGLAFSDYPVTPPASLFGENDDSETLDGVLG